MKKTRIYRFTMLCVFLLLQLPMSAVAGQLLRHALPDEFSNHQLVIGQRGQVGVETFIGPTHAGKKMIDPKTGVIVGDSKRLEQDPSFSFPSGYAQFTINDAYFCVDKIKRTGCVDVTDYNQRTGDPGILQASAFEAGVMVNSLWAWLSLNGYDASNHIYQPDFFLAGGGDVYYAVDLAALGAAGKAFTDLWALGSIFSINASGGLDAMPFYMFSSTEFGYTEGSGWTGGTPLAQGTQLSFDAFHETHSAVVPEPGSLLLVCIGLTGAWLSQRKSRRQF